LPILTKVPSGELRHPPRAWGRAPIPNTDGGLPGASTRAVPTTVTSGGMEWDLIASLDGTIFKQ
ncbi:MAG: hypothetical protein LBC60_12460, partial [Spirochaetaceae bacterium]|nr:hypothetical protein [Spirochaetaceae bacterium]